MLVTNGNFPFNYKRREDHRSVARERTKYPVETDVIQNKETRYNGSTRCHSTAVITRKGWTEKVPNVKRLRC